MSLSNNFPTIRPTLNLDFANSGVLDPRITFTRTTPAVYYDAETVALAEQNLLLQSQTFENSYWTKEFVTVTADDAVAPDGTTTADKIIEDTSNGGHRVYATVNGVLTGSVYTFSCFVKKNERQYAILTTYDTVTRYRVFDLTNGVLGGSSANITSSSITSFGNGWYRCSITWTSTAGQVFPYVGLASGDTNAGYVGNGSSMWAWGAQLEQRSVVTAYTPTTTQAITNYVPQLMTAAAGQPRFDYDPITRAAKGLLIEEARTNLLTYSSDFDNAFWVKTRAVVTANATIAPDGTLTADKLAVDTTAATTHRLNGQTTLSAISYTLSLYAKKSELNYLILQINTIANSLTWFDLNAGTISTLGSGVTASISNVGNGWYRCSITGTSTAGTADAVIYPAETNGVSTTTVANGTSGIFIWGAQLEAGAFATSYIATTTGSVQRNADVAAMTGTNFSSWFNNSEGTLYCESLPALVVNQGVASLDDGTTSNRMAMQTTSASILAYRFVSPSGNFTATSASFGSLTAKAAFVYKQSDQTGYVNSTVISGVTNQSLVPVVNRLSIGFALSVNTMTGTIRKLSYYPVRLTNTQLQNLTKS